MAPVRLIFVVVLFGGSGCAKVLGADFDSARTWEEASTTIGPACTPAVEAASLEPGRDCVAQSAEEDVTTEEDDDCDGHTGNHEWSVELGSWVESGYTMLDVGSNGVPFAGGSFVEDINLDGETTEGESGGFLLKVDRAGAFGWSKVWAGSQWTTTVSMTVGLEGGVLYQGQFNAPVDFGTVILDPGEHARPAWAIFADDGTARGAYMAQAVPDPERIFAPSSAVALSGGRFGIFVSSLVEVELERGVLLKPGASLLVVDSRAQPLAAYRWSHQRPAAAGLTLLSSAARGRCDQIYVTGTTTGRASLGDDESIELTAEDYVASAFVMELVPTQGSRYTLGRTRPLQPALSGGAVYLAPAPDETLLVAGTVPTRDLTNEVTTIDLGGQCPPVDPVGLADAFVARLDANLECLNMSLIHPGLGSQGVTGLAVDSHNNVLLAVEGERASILKLDRDLEPIWERWYGSEDAYAGSFASLDVDAEDSVIIVSACIRSGADGSGQDRCLPPSEIGGDPMSSDQVKFMAKYRP